MQDAPTEDISDNRVAAPRSLGLLGLLVSLFALALGMGAWLGIFSGLIFAAALLFDGMASVNALIEDFDRLDPRRLDSDFGAQRALFAGGVLIYLSALASLVTIARLMGKGQAAGMLGWTGAWPAITRTGWLLIACALIYHVVAGATLRFFFPEFALWLIPPRDATALILSFVMIVILAPLAEELLFRGWIFGSLRARFSAGVTILATAVLFAVVHMDPTGLYPVAVLVPGFVLSVIRERTGSVKPAVLAHAIYNGVGWLLLLFATALFVR
ncbi:MAG: CPBP family intramembrane metalloprotease [Beijerinckiaceae bacterium]|nr:CPBP family intramembrane metalloprotease [Beijerinckiaceae bacterium]